MCHRESYTCAFILDFELTKLHFVITSTTSGKTPPFSMIITVENNCNEIFNLMLCGHTEKCGHGNEIPGHVPVGLRMVPGQKKDRLFCRFE